MQIYISLKIHEIPHLLADISEALHYKTKLQNGTEPEEFSKKKQITRYLEYVTCNWNAYS